MLLAAKSPPPPPAPLALDAATFFGVLALAAATVSLALTSLSLPNASLLQQIQFADALGGQAAVLCLAAYTFVMARCGARLHHLLLSMPVLALLLLPSSPSRLSLTWQLQSCVRLGRQATDKIRIVPERKLLFCAIEKNANTAFEDLLCSLTYEHYPSWVRWVFSTWRTWANFELQCFWGATFPPNQGVSLSAAYAALRHEEPGWVSAVFVRDPLERFLSGWLSKCTNDHDLDREVCTKVFGSPDASLAHAVAVINATVGDVGPGLAEDHFRLQSAFCSGAVGSQGFDRYYLLDSATSRANVADMLSAVGITEPAEATAAFDYHFKPPPRQLTASKRADVGVDGPLFAHATGAHTLVEQYFSDPALVKAVLHHYAVDYRNLAQVLRVPPWAAEAVGDAYLRQLGLLHSF